MRALTNVISIVVVVAALVPSLAAATEMSNSTSPLADDVTQTTLAVSTVEASGPVAIAEAADVQLTSPISSEKNTSHTKPSVVAQPAVKVNGASSLLSVFVGLLFILGLILALAWLVKRIGQGGMASHNHLRIVASLPLGTRERLALIDVGGKQILLGLTPQHINTLHVFDEPVIDAATAEPSEFALKLRSLLNPVADKHNSAREPRQ